MAAAFNEDGYPALDDLNGAFRDGHGPMPFSNTAERRMSSAAAYLSENGRARTNLTVLCGSEAARIIFADDRRASAVEFRGVAGLRRVEAGQVILSAGAVHSPELLMRSGVGPGAALAQAGIKCVRDLPGVGANLQNHPILYLSFLTAPQDRQRDAPLNYNALRYSSGLPGCLPSDMFMPVMSRPTWNALGRSINALGVAVYKSLSKGAVRLEPNGALHVDLDLFSDERDLARMVDGLRRCFRYLSRLPKGMCRHLFVPTRQSLIQQLLRPTPLNAARATLIAGLMDAAPFLSGPITRAVGVDPVGLIDDDEALTRFVHEHSSPMYHLVGTCRMGAHDDPMAVVDERCAVSGVTGLRVVDGSVIPTIVRANTNIPIIMVAEKAADMILADARGG